MWRDDPATTMVIGWDQRSGSEPVLLYDTEDRGQVARNYRYKQKPDRVSKAQGMNSHFVRLTGLKPGTVYYFIVFDTEGPGKRFSFRTAPATPDERLSIIAGGDSRNHREARVDANKVVSKLRPHCIMFGGDMTQHDSPSEWQEWFDDWQYTIGSDGRLFPVIAARGNHESGNPSIAELFDSPSPDVYFALSLGGNLLRIYTLNTLIPVAGDQRDWLQRDLVANQQSIWRFAQYHQAVRPHTSSKLEREDILLNWSTLFHKYKVHVVVECDAHVVKMTWPVRPSKEAGSDRGFIRDDNNGTIYLGEGTWGAPLRANDNDKKWTMASGSFNQFSWIFVDQRQVEIRTVRTDGGDRVREVDHHNIFDPPLGLVLWNPPSGDVIVMRNKSWKLTPGADPPIAELPPIQRLKADEKGLVRMDFTLEAPSDVDIILVTTELKEMAKLSFPKEPKGAISKTINLSKAPPGEYMLIIKAGGKVINRFAFIK